MANILTEPLTRREQFLQAIASGKGGKSAPEPQNREEIIFAEIADTVKGIIDGGGGGGIIPPPGGGAITFDEDGNIVDTTGDIGIADDDDIDGLFP